MIYQIKLPLFKQGDDLYHSIRCTDTYAEAMVDYAETLDLAKQQLLDIAKVIEKYDNASICVHAQTHNIDIDGPEEMLNELLREGLVDTEDWDEEDEWGDWEDLPEEDEELDE